MKDQLADRLRTIPTGTLSTALRQQGLVQVWMHGPRPISSGQPRVAGKAVTVRFVPAREDITTPESLSRNDSFRAFIDMSHPGCVLVASTSGVDGAGVVGDILAARLVKSGVLGLVTDGAVRDVAAVAQSGLQVWARGAAAPPSVAGLHYCEADVIVACGGVAVVPGDYIVADDDGAVVVPAAMAVIVVQEAEAKERFESWVLQKVQDGETLLGLYPPSAQTKARYAQDIDKDCI